MEDQIVPLSENQTFCFSCSPEVPCFNECCRDLTQFLTPYDILRLKQHLDIPSDAFIKQYTTRYDGPRSGLPVITLKPVQGPGSVCSFVTPKGCAVYDSRPSSCRIYPLMRGVGRCRETGKLTEQYALIRESHCRGHEDGKKWTAGQWIADQALTRYHKINDLFLAIIALKNRTGTAPLDLKSKQMFHLAMYDLDNFRRQIKETDILGPNRPEDTRMDRILENDTELLIFGHEWIRQVLFPG